MDWLMLLLILLLRHRRDRYRCEKQGSRRQGVKPKGVKPIRYAAAKRKHRMREKTQKMDCWGGVRFYAISVGVL